MTAGFSTRRARAAGGPVKLRMGYLLPAASQLGAGATAMADEVAKHSNGRIQIQAFPDAALGAEIEMIKGVQLGTIDLAFITGSPLSSVVPEIGVFNIPFLFQSVEQAHRVMDGPIGDSYRTKFSAKGLVALSWGENGLRHLTNSKHPIATPADLKGLKLRLPQSQAMLLGFRAMGADVSPLPFPQLYAALQSGTFDGQENPIPTILAAKFAQVQKFLSLTSHVYDPALIIMSPDAHDDLSPEDQAIVAAAARLGAAASRRFATDAAANGVTALRQGGMDVLTEVDRAAFARAAQSANPDFEKLFSPESIAAIRQTV